MSALLGALAVLFVPRGERLLLRRAERLRAPYWDTANDNDYDVVWRGKRVGRIDRDPTPHESEVHVPWRWFLDVTPKQAGKHGRAATLGEAREALRQAWVARQADRGLR